MFLSDTGDSLGFPERFFVINYSEREIFMKVKKIAALLLCSVMAVSLMTGCGGIKKETAVATFDDTNISLGTANFAARLQQASSDDFYVMYFGEEVWSSDLYGSGTTMEDELKTGVMDSFQEMYLLQAHMDEYGVSISEEEKEAITKAASDFIAANDQKALDALGAEQAIVEEYLTLLTIQSKMYQEIIAGADTNISDAEANTGTYSYVTVSKTAASEEDGETESGETVLADVASTVNLFLTEARAGGLETAAEKYGYTVEEGTFTAEDEYLEEAVLAALNALEEGAVSDVIDTEEEYYVVRLNAKTDAAATEETRASLVEERQTALYDETIEGWKEEHTWTVDEKVWGTVAFDNLFTTIEESTEELEETTEQ